MEGNPMNKFEFYLWHRFYRKMYRIMEGRRMPMPSRWASKFANIGLRAYKKWKERHAT